MSLRRTLTALGLVSIALLPCRDSQALGRVTDDRAQSEEPEPRIQVTFEGIVVDPNGSPARGAVVVSSAGGRAIADSSGSYRLEVSVAADARSVQITAVGGTSVSLVASTSLDVAANSALVRVAPLELASGGTCQPSWLPTFGGQPGVNDAVYALAVFDDGGGPALYVGGLFTTAGGVLARSVAKWDGSSWSALGSGMGGSPPVVHALTVFDDGSGPALYAAGFFGAAGGVPAKNIAKWDGSSWSALGSGVNNRIDALVAFDDGDGPALYVAGHFTTAGGVAANRVAKWNGSSWAPLGSGVNAGVEALAVFDDGGGPALYAAGGFTTAGGVAANRIAEWNGSSWAPLGSGTSAGIVSALAVFDDGGGPALYAGGNFAAAGGMNVNQIAKWNGSTWAPLGSGMNGSGTVDALLAFDDGSGPALYVGGSFTSAGGAAASRIAKWDGSSWTSLGSGVGGGSTITQVFALAALDDGGGPALHAGGEFTTAGSAAATRAAKWDGSSWEALGSGVNGYVQALALFDDGAGPALHAGGIFTSAGGVTANRIAKWDGSGWAALGSGVDSGVEALAVFDDGNGTALYAGGFFTTAGGVSANRIAKWDGSSWAPLGSGTNATVRELAVFDDGSGLALYAGGFFTIAGGVPASQIAKWNGSSWSPLGSGMNQDVEALVVFDDGGGEALYAAGSFTSAGGVAANRIAKWNGSSWAPLGSGMNQDVEALAVFDDGDGPALYAGGEFTTAGGVAANRIAKWDGSTWSALGSGTNRGVWALAVFDDGNGQELYAGGFFSSAGGVAASGIAKWDGTNWAPLGSGIGIVHDLEVFNDRTGPALYVGNESFAPDSGDSFLAKWGCPDTNPPAITCPSKVVVYDGSSAGKVVTFTVTALDEEDPLASVVCVPPSGSFFPRGTTIVTCTATDFSGNQSTCQFPVSVHSKVREL